MKKKPTLEEKYEMPLLVDRKRFLPYSNKMYGKTFTKWVDKNWRTASEREIQVMHRSWIAAGGNPK
jgi:hypothetical protein